MWSVGVVVFVLLSGQFPFFDEGGGDNAAGQGLGLGFLDSIAKGKYSFSVSEWGGVSDGAKDFIRRLLVVAPSQRLTASQALSHPWLAAADPPAPSSSSSSFSSASHATPGAGILKTLGKRSSTTAAAATAAAAAGAGGDSQNQGRKRQRQGSAGNGGDTKENRTTAATSINAAAASAAVATPAASQSSRSRSKSKGPLTRSKSVIATGSV